ncbi:hypothetical protein [Fimbriiglobus ruber]|uniref:Uncharacterized protein n=1 Tax=Fimbriiglobus ruber TaxID=1908690 RepID=A0A225DAN9_9BACT|nr:hypothetical protein [Fimbriiglobus ruber]OWK38522.1 hypothetical protein FRUB_07642 [Fimbriiglobus ruber]
MPSHPELEFFNSLSGRLEVELSVPAEPIGDLENLRAPADAQMVRLELRAEVFNRDTEDFRPLTPDELESVAFRGRSIQLRSEDGEAVSHDAPNGSFFTVRELLQAVEETERRTRAQSEWFGGIDVHHVFFEGIHPGDGGVWDIYWGS